MEVRHRQQLGLTRGKPFLAFLPLALWAMPVAAGIVGNADHAAVLALLDVPPKRRGSAQLDRTNHPALDATEMASMRLTISLAMVAENIRHFQTGRHGATAI
jgi:hypothetical protein